MQLIDHLKNHPACRGRAQLILSDNAKGELIYRISLEDEDFDVTITPLQTCAQKSAQNAVRAALNIQDTKKRS